MAIMNGDGEVRSKTWLSNKMKGEVNKAEQKFAMAFEMVCGLVGRQIVDADKK